jgi:hypothetical protein
MFATRVEIPSDAVNIRPMRLSASDGDYVDLQISRYQYAKADNQWDANWLQIRLEASRKGRTWTTTDPMLLTWDVKELADWLDEAAQMPEASSELGFPEPNLTFERRPDKNGKVDLTIWLELEARPRWAHKGYVDERDFSVDLDLDTDQLTRAADDLRSQLERFPAR